MATTVILLAATALTGAGLWQIWVLGGRGRIVAPLCGALALLVIDAVRGRTEPPEGGA